MVMPSIVEAIKKQTSIIITDIDDIMKSSPKEYQVYKRLDVNTLAYVIHRAIAQKNTMDRVRMALSPDEIKTDNDVIINFFGGMEITTLAGVWKEQDFNSTKSSRAVAYLLLQSKSAHSALAIADALYPEDGSDVDTINKNIRGYMYRLGYQNLISIVFDLITFRDGWMRKGKAGTTDEIIEPLHLVFVEEPEAHLHVQVNRMLEEYGQAQVKKGIKLARALWYVPRININKAVFEELLTRWGVYTHTKRLSEQIFIPLEVTDNKAITYAPFQTMAQYYISLGYPGIVYGSTVCSVGKNIVLFDKQMAHPIGAIEDYRIS